VFQLKLDELTGDSQLTNSVYLDNHNMDLYQARLTKSPHAICIRIRWYGTTIPELAFVERKTHEDSWTGGESVKERFVLQVNQVQPFLEGKYTLAMATKDLTNAALKKGAPPGKDELAAFTKLFTEVATAIRTKRLEPMMRTRCMRVAYQIPFQPTVRVSIDTNLSMMKENPVGEKTCKELRRWYRDPTLPVPHNEITSFPHAVLEVKMALRDGEVRPDWVDELVADKVALHEVDKFSKFGHGCAVLMHDKIPFLPYWIDDVSIRASITRSQTTDYEVDDSSGYSKSPQSSPRVGSFQNSGGSSRNSNNSHIPPASLGESDRKTPLIRRTDSDGSPLPAAGPRARNNLNYVPGIGKMRSGTEYQMLNPEDTDPAESCCLSIMGSSMMPRKMPMKIEPKTFFANERTFLKWLHAAVTLGGRTRTLSIAYCCGIAVVFSSLCVLVGTCHAC
jgi:hypothetical protein